MRFLRGMIVALVVATTTLGAPGLGAASYGSEACCDHDHVHVHDHVHGHDHHDPGHVDAGEHAHDADADESRAFDCDSDCDSSHDRMSESCCATSCSACGCCGLGVSSGLPTRASLTESHQSSTAILLASTHDPHVGLRSGVFRPPRTAS